MAFAALVDALMGAVMFVDKERLMIDIKTGKNGYYLALVFWDLCLTVFVGWTRNLLSFSMLVDDGFVLTIVDFQCPVFGFGLAYFQETNNEN